MKELKKYLHLYLGCDLLVLKTKEVVSFDDLDSGQTWPVWTRDKKYCSPKGCCANGFRFKEIKPLLRPLSSMTDKEGVEYAQFYCKSPVPKGCEVVIKPNDDYVHVSIMSSGGGSGLSLFPGGATWRQGRSISVSTIQTF